MDTELQKIENFVDGAFAAPLSGQYMDNEDPATGSVYSYLPDSDAKDVDAAVNAAYRAFPKWSATRIEERSALLSRIADLIERDADRLAHAECIDNGKPLALAKRVDIPRAASNFRFFAAEILQFSGASHAMGHSAINYTLREPLGVVACISPWNLPLYLLTWKIAPALAAGNCVVAKPSEITPVTAHLLAKLCLEAGLPAGVLNIVHGRGEGAGAALCVHPRIAAVSFTGGTETGREIARATAGQFKKLSLELGGKNPNIIFADCDYQKMLDTTVLSSFSNQGEICLCASRIFVERKIYGRVRDDLVERARALKVGDPLALSSEQGAVASREHQEKILSCIERAKMEGGKILCGGRAVHPEGRCSKGYFVAPTVIEGLSPECRTNQEEIFGPVVTLIPFDSQDEVIAHANATEYGLAAVIWTQDISRAHTVAAKLRAGVIWINCWLLRDLRTPFGGMKASGLGREGGEESLRFFTEAKNVCVKIG